MTRKNHQLDGKEGILPSQNTKEWLISGNTTSRIATSKEVVFQGQMSEFKMLGTIIKLELNEAKYNAVLH